MDILFNIALKLRHEELEYHFSLLSLFVIALIDQAVISQVDSLPLVIKVQLCAIIKLAPIYADFLHFHCEGVIIVLVIKFEGRCVGLGIL